nr:MAG TPA: hypothetical protein [Caudoviricetes sp.]
MSIFPHVVNLNLLIVSYKNRLYHLATICC